MKETKNQKFLRLMENRLLRTLEDLRLISQLGSTNYRNTPEEAQEVILHLDAGLKTVAQTFDIPYKSWIGGVTKYTRIAPQMGEINEIDAAKAIALIQAGEPENAISLLQAAINKDPR